MSKASRSEVDSPRGAMSAALAEAELSLAGAHVALVSPADASAIVSAERQSFLEHLPRMGLRVSDLRYRHPHDLYRDDVVTVLRDADLIAKLVHGPENRTGLAQAVFRTLGVRCAGHRTHTDVLSQRKSLVKRLMAGRRVPTLPYALVRSGNLAAAEFNTLRTYPAAAGYVLKPDDGNASEGLQYLPDLETVSAALLTAPDGFYLVEPYTRGKVLTVGVATLGGEALPLEPMEYLLADDEPVMDQSWKRQPSRALATGIKPETRDAVMGFAVELHRAVEARGLSRSDFIVTRDSNIFALEINTNVGLSERHDLAASFRENGFDYRALLWAHLGSALNSNTDAEHCRDRTDGRQSNAMSVR
jgi:D-alanine-D-alanine ligase